MRLREAVRTLRRSPGTSLVVVATVAVGICAVVTVFAVVDAFFLKPLPGVARQSELVNVHATAADGSTFHSVSLPTWRDLGDGNGAFTGLAAFSSRLVSLTAGGEPRLATVQIVTQNYFSVLGARAALGRFFLPKKDEAPGRDAVVVLSHRAWKNALGGDPAILGRVVSINGHPFTVVGVTEAGFNGTFLGQPFDVWVPAMMAPVVATADRLTDHYDAPRAQAAFETLVARAAALPGVESATTTARMPLGFGNHTSTVSLPESPRGEAPVTVDSSDVGDGYFRTLRLPLVSGRPFGPADGPTASRAAIVNETLARRLWPGSDPIGRTLRERDEILTVVGVARDSRYRRLWEEPRSFLYVSEHQSGSLRRDLVVRGGGTFAALAAALRREIGAAEPNLPFAAVLPVRRHMGISLLPQLAGSAVAGSLGLVGLLLAAIGLAAQVAHSVIRRTREIGIRMALGARPADVFLLEASRGAKTAGVGLVLGLAGALLLSRALAKFLFGVSPADPLTFGAVAPLLAAVSLAAILSPARRAARISPLEALRNE